MLDALDLYQMSQSYEKSQTRAFIFSQISQTTDKI